MKKLLYAKSLCIFGCLLSGNMFAMARIDVKRIPTGPRNIFSVQFDRSGNRIVTDYKELWDASTGNGLLICDENSRMRLDKRREILFAFLKDYVRVYDPKNAAVLMTLQNSANATKAATDRQHVHIATGGNDGKTLIWDFKTSARIGSFAEHTAAVTSLLFFKRSPLLVTTSDDSTCKIWDLRQPASVKTVQIFSPVKLGEINRTENVIVCSSVIDVYNRRERCKEKAVNVTCVDWANGERGTMPLDNSLGGEVVLNRPSNRVAVASGLDHTWVKDLSQGVIRCTILKHGAQIHNIGMNKMYVATAALDRTVKIWDPKVLEHHSLDAKCCRSLQCEKLIGTIACDRGGSFVLAGQGNGVVKIWNINSGNKLQQCIASQDGITAAEFSRDGHRFATGSDDGTLAIGTSV